MTASIFAAVELAPRDPILGLNEAFNADARTTKVNLGVGVYCDDNGKIPLLAAVRAAEKTRLEAMPARGYQPIEGPASYNQAVQNLIFGADSALLKAAASSRRSARGTGASRSARIISGACCRRLPCISVTRAGRTTAPSSSRPVSASRTTPTTTLPRGA
jgi:aspartate/tyrosine/aromatic aminotransferase